MTAPTKWKSLDAWSKARFRWLVATVDHSEVDKDGRPWPLRPEQLTPPGDWLTWVYCGGRGTGKTRAAAEDFSEYARTHPGARLAIVAEDFGAARDVCVEGATGLWNVVPRECMPSWNRSLGELRFANDATVKLFSAEQPDDLRGPQFDRIWVDELCKFAYPRAVLDQISFALRLGDRPQLIVTTTPRPLGPFLDLMAQPSTIVTRGSTFDNARNLPDSYLEDLLAKYEGRALGRQELYAEIVSDVEGALVRREWIDQHRVISAPRLERIVVGVDPSTGTTETSRAVAAGAGRETGIVAVGMSAERHLYVLDDRSMRGSPDEWAREAVNLYRRLGANALVVETNVGNWVVSTLRGAEQGGERTKIEPAHARASKIPGVSAKRARLEPIAGLYEQGRVHHVGSLPLVEDALCSWDPIESRWSPDRIDALVWAGTWLDPWRGRGGVTTTASQLVNAR